MDRFFIPIKFDSDVIQVSNDEAHHMLSVKRHKEGDKVILFNGAGDECIGEIINTFIDQASHKKIADISILSVGKVDKEVGVGITVAFSVPKGKRADLIVQKCSELGVLNLVPLSTERGIVKSGSGNKLEKWRRIAIEASKQCGRNIVTEVTDFISFDSIEKLISTHKLSLIFDKQEHYPGIKNVLKNNISANTILCIIGPEGGFSEKEMEKAQNYGCLATKLTPQILRVETATIAAVAMVVYEFSL